MTIALQYCHITVNDLDESLSFYRDALGLEVRNDVGSGGFRWVTLGSPDQPGLEIVLSELHAGRLPPTATPCRNCLPRAFCR